MSEFEPQHSEHITSALREAIIGETLVGKMCVMYRPHAHLRGNEKAAAIYIEEMCKTINSRIASVQTKEQFRGILRQIWSSVVAKHTSQYWFSIPDVLAATNKANKEFLTTIGQIDRRLPKATFSHEGEQRKTDKSRGEGWTIEGARRHIAETERLMADGSLPASFGRVLIKIPQAALRRLEARQPSASPESFDML